MQRGQATQIEQGPTAVLKAQQPGSDKQKISDVYELPITVVNNVVYEGLLGDKKFK